MSRWLPAPDRTTLKIIAVLSMLCDHFAFIFVDFRTHAMLYRVMRGFGRLAFPIFCFVLVQGFLSTRDVRKYIFRLTVFALLSEIPFDLAFFGMFFYPGAQNVFFTLLIGMLVLVAIQRYETNVMAVLLFIAAGSAAAHIFYTDYTFFGVLLISLFYIFRQNKFLQFCWIGILIVAEGGMEVYAVFALPLCLLYNPEKQERRLPRYFFYVFYPLHLLVFALLRILS